MQMHEGVDRNYIDYSWNLNTTEESYNFNTFSNKILLAIAAAIGTTNHTIAAKATFNPASIEANGPTNPTIPNPADCGVPLTENSATGIAERIAVDKHGIKITGYLNKLGIINFIAPRAMANVTPELLTFHEWTTNATAVAATPIAAAPADTPFN